MTSTITLEDAYKSVDLMEGEQILHTTGRHVVVLFAHLIIPLGIILVAGLVAFYRALGGGFLMLSGDTPRQMDLLNQAMIYLAVALGLGWIQSRLRKPKQVRTQMVLAGSVIALLTAVYFRNRGGRLFYVDPLALQLFDPINIALYIVMALAAIGAFYSFIDWSNDQLVLTNKRIIYDNDTVIIPKLIERRDQLQIAIDDIQNVVARTDTYPKHWLKFGTVIVQSATATGNKIIFNSANKPKEAQDKIMAEVRKIQGQSTEKKLEGLINTRVFKAPADKPPIKFRFQQKRFPEFFRWLIEENPTINEAKGEVIWRAHWLMLIEALLVPVGFLFLGGFLILAATRLGLFGTFGWVVAVILLLLAFLGWSAWEIEDHRNDMYILTPTNIIDIDKKPFGPEDRRTASLGAVQNVSFKTTFYSNFLGYGDVLVETAGGGGKFTFTHVPRPRDVVAQINDYLSTFKRGEKERNLNDTVALLRHYHEAQKRQETK